MAPLHTPSHQTEVIQRHQDDQVDKGLRDPSQNCPPAEAFHMRVSPEPISRVGDDDDDDTQYDSANEEEVEEEITLLKIKLSKYKRQNKELTKDFKEQRASLLGLEHDYALLKLELAKAQSSLDCKDMAKDEAIASKDLKILQLVQERDDLTHQVKELKLVESRLEKSLHRKDSRLASLVEERDAIEQDLRFTIKERDNVVYMLKRLGRVVRVGVPEAAVPSNGQRARGLLRRCFGAPRAIRRQTPLNQIVPVDAIIADSMHSR